MPDQLHITRRRFIDLSPPVSVAFEDSPSSTRLSGPFGSVSTPVEGSITNGREIPELSADAETFLGVPEPNTLPTLSGPFSGTQVIEDRQVNGQARIQAGADITFINCVILGSAGASGAGYTVRCNEGSGARVRFIRCLIICRTGAGGNEDGVKNIVAYGDVSIELHQCVVRGGADGFYGGGSWSTPGTISTAGGTASSLVPNARLYFHECWFGDGERVGSIHADETQLDGQGIGYVVLEKCRYMGYNIPQGSDTLTTRVTDPSTAGMMSTCFIITDASAPSNDAHNIAIVDSWFEGGNFVVDTNDTADGPTWLLNNWWGLRNQFGPRTGVVTELANCRWGQTGETNVPGSQDPISVTDGDLIPGSDP